MRKRKILSIFLMISIIGSTAFLGAVKVVDPVLENATQITRKIFNESIENGEDKKHGYFYSSYLMGVDGKKDYILSTCATGGYAIFEKESMELLEYSDTEISPYTSGVKENYYLGPNNYYIGSGVKLQNINTGECVRKEKASVLAKELKEKLKYNREKRKKITDKNENSDSKTIPTDFSKDVIDENPGPTGSELIDADSYKVKIRTYIPNYQFFMDNEYFGNNQNGTCVSVASQLLLSYNNWANDGRIIPEQTENPNEKFFLVGREHNRDKPYSVAMMGTTSSDLKFDDEISFYEILKSYINPLDWSDDENPPENAQDIEVGASMRDGYNGINAYLTKYAPEAKKHITMSYSLTDVVEWNNALEKLRDEINDGRPAIASIYVYDLKGNADYIKTGHAVVVYGMQTIEYEGQALDGFIANFGWIGGGYTHTWFNASWVTGYLTLRTTHMHDNITALNSQNHVFQCMDCSASVVKDRHVLTNQIKILSSNEADFEWYHQNICICGYATKQSHDLNYIQIFDAEKHGVTCECGYSYEEEHFYKSGNMCWRCGATADFQY